MAGDNTTPLNRNTITRILFISVSRIGDTLITTPAIRAISQAFPFAEITVYVHPKRKNILKNIKFIHKIKSLTKLSAQFNPFLQIKKYDLAFLFDNDHTYTRFALKISERVISFESENTQINSKLYKQVKKPNEPTHAVLDKILLAESIGVTTKNHRIEYRVTESEISAANDQINALNIPDNAFLVGIQAISFHSKPFRNWPISSFIALCKRIKDSKVNSVFLFFGSKEDQQQNEMAVNALQTSAYNLSGYGIRETAAIMKRCSLLIGVDTGPTHIMGTMDIPMVGIYHCLMPSWLIGPLQHPCFEAVDQFIVNKPCNENSDISNIDIDKVFSSVKKVANL